MPDRPWRLSQLAFSLALIVLAPAAAAAADVTPGAPPQIDPTKVVFYPDQGRLEIEGQHLTGVQLRWETAKGSGTDVCVEPAAAAGHQRCTFSVPRTLTADARFDWAPASAATGAPPPAAFTPLRPARVIIDHVLPSATTTVDLSGGIGRVPLAHPEAVAAVDCAQATCELGESAVEVRALSPAATGLTLHVHLAPRYYVLRDDTPESTFIRTVSVLHCPAEIVSGPPLRRADAAQVLVRLGSRCGGDPRALHWTANGEPITVARTASDGDAVLVLLTVGDIEDATLTVTAARPETEGSVLAVARTPTRPAPLVQATLEIPGHGAIDFLPSNRDAVVHVAPVGEHAHLVPLPEEGAYHVMADASGTRVRGEEGVGGYVALRFGYRVDGLPAPFAATDLAVVTEALQRPIHEASVPAPIGPTATGPAPLVELVCTDEHGGVQRIVPGKRTSIPFSRRDGCRVIIHRERFKPEDGTQDLTVDVDVTKVDDSARSDAHVSERMVLRPSPEPRIFWIKGVKAQFDRVAVRIAHVADDDRYVGARDTRTSLPAVQWTLVVGEGRFRFYATAAIPTGLFHITAPSGVLTLNFGVLSRVTWLDHEGHEGLLGLELGAMGVGLAATTVASTTSAMNASVTFPPTLAALAGLGVSIPIGNRGEPTQASVNLHAWLAYELRSDYTYPSGPYNTPVTASHWSFLFGPSITIGNIGTNL